MPTSHTIVYLPAYGVTFDDGWIVAKDYYFKQGVPRVQLPEIEQLMVEDRLIVFTDTYIYANTSVEEAYALHRQAEQLGRELFRTGAAISFKEKAGFTDMMFYKTLILP